MKRTLSIFSITVLTVVMIAGAVGAGTQQTSSTDMESVIRFSDGSDTGGLSTLTRTEDMVHVTVEAARLRAGNAYTLWWVVFNDPAACSAPGCGEDDIFNADRSEEHTSELQSHYSISTLVCVPNALSQGATNALGAQAGEAALAQVATEAGFTRVRRAAENPMNLVLEATP